MLKREEREQGKGRRWRKNFKLLQNQMLLLEEDEQQLEMVYPQVKLPSEIHGCITINAKTQHMFMWL